MRLGTSVPRRRRLLLAGAVAVIVVAGSVPAGAAGSLVGSPTTGLRDGSTVKLSGSGFGSGTALFVVQCADRSGQAACDLGHLAQVTSSAGGTFTTSFAVHTGAIGSGTCGIGSSCIVAVSDAAQTYSAALPITFIESGSPSPTPADTPSPAAAHPKATSSGPNRVLLALVGLAVVAVLAGTFLWMSRRRRT
ncbi:MAG: Neocarzinostatin family [Actinomycetota bacterium]|nr:Neocarzinostatin family [Actinomycetota bacterium]